MNENDLYLVKECKFDNPLCSCFRYCHFSYFHKIIYECIYDIKFKNIANSEMISFTVSVKNIDFHDLNNKLKVARERSFIFNQKNQPSK